LPLPAGLVPEVECIVVVPDDALPSAVVSGLLSSTSTKPVWVSVELRAPSGRYLARQEGELASFRFERVPAGDSMPLTSDLALGVPSEARLEGSSRTGATWTATLSVPGEPSE
jgi:hypothetical protein